MKLNRIAPKDLARRRVCTLKYIYDLLTAGRIPGAKKLGKQWSIPAEALKQPGGGRPIASAVPLRRSSLAN